MRRRNRAGKCDEHFVNGAITGLRWAHRTCQNVNSNRKRGAYSLEFSLQVGLFDPREDGAQPLNHFLAAKHFHEMIEARANLGARERHAGWMYQSADLHAEFFAERLEEILNRVGRKLGKLFQLDDQAFNQRPGRWDERLLDRLRVIR